MAVERKCHPGGYYRSIRRFNQYRESAKRADREVEMFIAGEPSEAFFPPHQEEPDTIGHIVFSSISSNGKKNGRVRVRRERETIATPQDIANRIREQLERYIELEHYAGHPAKLPPEWRRIGVKYWDEIQAIKGDSITLSSAETSLSF